MKIHDHINNYPISLIRATIINIGNNNKGDRNNLCRIIYMGYGSFIISVIRRISVTPDSVDLASKFINIIIVGTINEYYFGM